MLEAEATWTLWLHWYQPNNGILVFLATHLFSPPLPRLYPSIQTGPPVLHRALSPFPHLHCAHSFFIILFPLGWDRILSRTKETVAVTEKDERQLGRSWTRDCVAFVHFNIVCTSFSLCPHFCLSLSPDPSLCFTLSPSSSSSCLLGFSFHYCDSYHHSQNSACCSFDFLHHIPPPRCLRLTLAR